LRIAKWNTKHFAPNDSKHGTFCVRALLDDAVNRCGHAASVIDEWL